MSPRGSREADSGERGGIVTFRTDLARVEILTRVHSAVTVVARDDVAGFRATDDTGEGFDRGPMPADVTGGERCPR